MTDPRARIISQTSLGMSGPPDDPEEEFLIVQVAYDTGERVFAHGNAQRGYYLRVSYEGRRRGMRSFALFASATAQLLAPAMRFSPKGLAAAVPTDEDIEALTARVLAMRQENKARTGRRSA